MAKSTAERTREADRRKKERGLTRTGIWAFPEDVPKIREYGRLLRAKRELEKTSR